MAQLVKTAVEKWKAKLLKANLQVRRTFPAEDVLRALARSVMKRQIHPLILFGDVIVDGECRWRGMMLENPEFEFDVIGVDREVTPLEISEIQLISAMHSTALESYDQAVACRDWLLQNPGATAKELAVKLDRDPSMIGKLMSLWRTIPTVVQAAEARKLGVMAWNQISLAAPEAQEGLLALHLAGTPASRLGQAAKRPQPKAEEAVKTTSIRIAVGEVVITVKGADLTLGVVSELLDKASKEAEKAKAQGLNAKTAERVWKDRATKAKAGK